MMRSFELLGTNITFNEKQLEFVSLRSAFQNLKNNLLLYIETDLEKAISNFSELPAHLADAVADCLSQVADLGVKTLCAHDIYDIDEESFQKRLIDEAKKQNLFAPIQAIGMAAKDVEQIEGGGGIGLIGGGFGAEGALRGMAIAGAVNLLTDALSSASAAGQRNAARQSAAEDLRKPAKFQKVMNSFEQLVDRGLWLAAKIISSRKPDALQFPSEDDLRQARALVSNLSKGRVPENRRKEVMVLALEKNLYDPASHVFLHSAFEKNENSERFSDFLGIDYQEHASKEGVKEVIGEAGSSLTYWFDDLVEIFGRFSSKDLHISPHISARKLLGAKEKYLKEGVPPPKSKREHALIELGEPVALIDTSVFGGGGTGIAFTTKGFAWREDFGEPMGVSWSALKTLARVNTGMFSVHLYGSKIDLTGKSISKKEFISLIFDLQAALKKRNWVI